MGSVSTAILKPSCRRGKLTAKPKTTLKHNVRNSKNSCVEAKLRRELRRLQQKYSLGLELKDVKWIPREDVFSGEVKNGIVYVYDKEPEEAVKTLRHEVLDFHLTEKIVRKPINLLNLILKHLETEIYQEKEKLINRLTELLQ